MKVEVTTWYLDMRQLGDLRPPLRGSELVVTRAEIPCVELSRFLYSAVGRDWHWTDRLSWSEERWASYLSRSEVQTWVGYLRGTPVGYVELEGQPEGNVEIAYFGLLPQFIGRGLGGDLLAVGVERAWAMGAKRVWVHSCSLDGPHALKNYQARGFRLYKTETRLQEVGVPAETFPGRSA